MRIALVLILAALIAGASALADSIRGHMIGFLADRALTEDRVIHYEDDLQ